MSDIMDGSLAVDNSKKRPVRRSNLLLKVFQFSAVALFFVALFLPNLSLLQEPARRTHCKNNLKQIGQALHRYYNDYDCFPPAYTVDAGGRALHSWRTLLLPYLEQSELYRKIDLAKPWNDPINAAAFETSLPVYRCPPGSIAKNQTLYLGVIGPKFFFHGNQPTNLSHIQDGTSNTLIVVEVPKDRTVPWMSPQDADEALILGLAEGAEFAHMGGFQGTFADGSVRSFSANLDRATLRALLTTSGNEVVGEF